MQQQYHNATGLGSVVQSTNGYDLGSKMVLYNQCIFHCLILNHLAQLVSKFCTIAYLKIQFSPRTVLLVHCSYFLACNGKTKIAVKGSCPLNNGISQILCTLKITTLTVMDLISQNILAIILLSNIFPYCLRL